MTFSLMRDEIRDRRRARAMTRWIGLLVVALASCDAPSTTTEEVLLPGPTTAGKVIGRGDIPGILTPAPTAVVDGTGAEPVDLVAPAPSAADGLVEGKTE